MATEKPPAVIELVAVDEAGLVGVIDIDVEGDLATIDTIAVHPDHARLGIATDLLDAAVAALPRGMKVLDAWTREDLAANSWYLHNGFVETFRYLHVYATSDAEVAAAITGTAPGMVAATAFLHAPIESEEPMRATFERGYICRRYELALSAK